MKRDTTIYRAPNASGVADGAAGGGGGSAGAAGVGGAVGDAGAAGAAGGAPGTGSAAPPTPPASTAADVVPETYDLKPPEGSTLTDADMERIAATSRELGLDQDRAQQLVEYEASITGAVAERSATAALEAIAPGGAEWTKVRDGWRAAWQADPALGATPDERIQNVQRAHTVLTDVFAKAYPKDAPALKQFLDESGLGDNPIALKLIMVLTKDAREAQFRATGSTTGTAGTRAVGDLTVLYENEGRGPTKKAGAAT